MTMVGKPLLITTENIQMVMGLPDHFYELSDDELGLMVDNFIMMAAVMANIIEGVMNAPRLLPLTARSLKATAQMLADEIHKEVPDDPRG